MKCSVKELHGCNVQGWNYSQMKCSGKNYMDEMFRDGTTWTEPISASSVC